MADIEKVELPADHVRAAEPVGTPAACVPFVVPDATRVRVEALAREEAVTRPVILIACLAVMVRRHGGPARFAIAASRRSLALPEASPADVLPIDFDFRARPTFRELLRETRELLRAAQAHAPIAYDVIAASSAETGGPSPPCQVGFGSDLPLLELSLRIDAGGDLALVAANVFDRATVERFGERYLVLLASAVMQSDQVVASLEPMSAAERHRVVKEWNGTARTFDDAPVHLQIVERAARTPAAPAIVVDGTILTYGELVRRATALAAVLRARGVGPDDRVGTWFSRSPEMVLGALAAMMAGAAYLPLDPAHPVSRIAMIAADAGAKLVLSTKDVSAEIGVPVLNVDAGEPAGSATESAFPPIHPQQAAYVIYTSGTTGRPKGAVMEHRALSNVVDEHVRLVGLSADDRVTQIASPAFDATITELWPTLSAGASLHIVDERTRLSPPDLVAWLRARRMTITDVPSAMMDAVLAEEWSDTSLRILSTGGEALRRRPSARHPFRLINVYGPTETTSYVTSETVEPGERYVTIGRPIQNTSIYVLDDDLAPVPVGVHGEIHIGGIPVGRGYVAAPELTADKFLPDPFAGAGARMYRTGDRGRWTADGNLEFAGRRDDQVKLRGFRIELGEIEANLRDAGAREAIVVVHREGPRTQLVAYVVFTEAISIDDLKRDLARTLPEYMVPSVIVVLDALPMNAGGKVDRRALPHPRTIAKEEFVAPRTPLERALVEIWQEVLYLERVSVNDDFFVLGGHSLSATQVVARIRDRLGVRLPIRQLFETPKLAQLGERVFELQLAALDPDELQELLNKGV